MLSTSRSLLLLLLFASSFSCSGSEAPELGAAAASESASELLSQASTESAVASPMDSVPIASVDVQEELPVDPTARGFLRVEAFLEGKPLGGVHFDVQWMDENNPAKTSSQLDPDGTRLIPFDHGSQLMRLIFYSGPHSAPQVVVDTTLLMGGRTHKVRVDLVAGAIVSGVVSDVEGNPVVGADVVAFFATPEELDQQENPAVRAFAKTDAQGFFRLGGFPAGPFVLEAAAKDQGTVWRPGGLIHQGAEIKDLEILLEPSHTVYGQVLDTDGQPVEGARVLAGKPNRRRNRRTTPNPQVFQYNPRARNVRSGADGTFQLLGIPESQGWMVNVTHPEFKRSLVYMDPGQIDVWVEMHRGVNLRGMVRDGADRPLAQVQIWLLEDEGEPSQFTDLYGKYLFGGLEPMAKVYMIYYKPGAGMAFLGPLAIEEGMDALDVVLDGGKTIEGVLLDVAGQPVSGAGVQIAGIPPEDGFPSFRMPEKFLDRYAVLTSADGSFLFEELYEGAFHLTVSAPGHAKLVVENVDSGGEMLHLQLKD